jgi:hypothetical protein
MITLTFPTMVQSLPAMILPFPTIRPPFIIKIPSNLDGTSPNQKIFAKPKN